MPCESLYFPCILPLNTCLDFLFLFIEILLTLQPSNNRPQRISMRDLECPWHTYFVLKRSQGEVFHPFLLEYLQPEFL